jgi:hypothetical protein
MVKKILNIEQFYNKKINEIKNKNVKEMGMHS